MHRFKFRTERKKRKEEKFPNWVCLISNFLISSKREQKPLFTIKRTQNQNSQFIPERNQSFSFDSFGRRGRVFRSLLQVFRVQVNQYLSQDNSVTFSNVSLHIVWCTFYCMCNRSGSRTIFLGAWPGIWLSESTLDFRIHRGMLKDRICRRQIKTSNSVCPTKIDS